jgi:hypothetical protein
MGVSASFGRAVQARAARLLKFRDTYENIHLDHHDGGFKIERSCKAPGCRRSEEHLDWLHKEQERAADEYDRNPGQEAC